MKGTKVWYFNIATGKKGIFANATVAHNKTGIGLQTIQKKLKEKDEYTWGDWIFARREVEK